MVVNAPNGLADAVLRFCPLERVFATQKAGIRTYLRLMRVHQWLKNVLLFVPISAAHKLFEFTLWPALLLGFLAFCLCASGTYIVNDLLDLESDRRHPRKRSRPLASGMIPILHGMALATLLLATGLGAGLAVGGKFFALLIVYLCFTSLYSLLLKRIAVLDCITLGVLYTLRIAAGGVAADVFVSTWLLLFSVFLFFSLAFLKRYTELLAQPATADGKLPGRDYLVSDAPLVLALGVGSGYNSILVLALYLNSDAILRLYRTPQCIWATVPVLLFWINRMWLKAQRREMHDDPLVFAVKDGPSLICGLLFAAALVAGAVTW